MNPQFTLGDDEPAAGRHDANSEDCVPAGDKRSHALSVRNPNVSVASRSYDIITSERIGSRPRVSAIPCPMKRVMEFPPAGSA
jgi:hypothetical protein